MMDVNGGYIEWVDRGLGPFAAWVSSFNSLCSNLADLPLYPIIFAENLTGLVTAHAGIAFSFFELYLVKLVCLATIVALNLRGIEDVGRVSAVLALLIVFPFLVQPFFTLSDLSPSAWARAPPAASIDWKSFMAVMFWKFQGWDALGSVAGEVRNPSYTYPVGILVSLLLITIMYAIPVAVGLSLVPDWTLWESPDGESGLTFADLGSRVGPAWVGSTLQFWIVLGAVFGQLGNGLAMMAASSRVAWLMSFKGMLPGVFRGLWTRFNSPAPAILINGTLTAALMLLTQDQLLVVDTLFNNISLGLEGISFLVLRYTEPDARRPYRVPGGMAVAWAITVAKTTVILFACWSSGAFALTVTAGANLGFVLTYVVVQWWRAKHGREDSVHRPGETGAGSSPVIPSSASARAWDGDRSPPVSPVALELVSRSPRRASVSRRVGGARHKYSAVEDRDGTGSAELLGNDSGHRSGPSLALDQEHLAPASHAEGDSLASPSTAEWEALSDTEAADEAPGRRLLRSEGFDEFEGVHGEERSPSRRQHAPEQGARDPRGALASLVTAVVAPILRRREDEPSREPLSPDQSAEADSFHADGPNPAGGLHAPDDH